MFDLNFHSFSAQHESKLHVDDRVARQEHQWVALRGEGRGRPKRDFVPEILNLAEGIGKTGTEVESQKADIHLKQLK